MTSPPRDITVSCPECGSIYQDWCRDSINFDLDPEMDDASYLDACSTATCPDCKHKVKLGAMQSSEDPLSGARQFWAKGQERPLGM